jgi:sugar phosphate isomerase/epimerase
MSKVSYAVQLFALRDDCAQDFPATLRAVKAMGYEAVEFFGYHGHSAETLKQMLDDNGLQAVGTHLWLGALSDDKIKEVAEFNAILGNPYLNAGGGEEYSGNREGALRLAEDVAHIAQAAAAHGAQFGYHNHSWEFWRVGENGDYTMEILAANTPPEVLFQLDTGNTQEGGADPIPFIEKWKHRMPTVHLKSFAKNHEPRYIGEDESDWKGILNALEGGPTSFYIVDQGHWPPESTAQECVARCLRNLQELLK